MSRLTSLTRRFNQVGAGAERAGHLPDSSMQSGGGGGSLPSKVKVSVSREIAAGPTTSTVSNHFHLPAHL